MEKGSEEWFREICERIGDQLLGIELHDSRFDDEDVSPPFQVYFIVPAQDNRNTVPNKVKDMTDYNGMFPLTRGSTRFVDALTFRFYKTDQCPTPEFLESIATSLKLTIPMNNYWKKFYFGVYSPNL